MRHTPLTRALGLAIALGLLAAPAALGGCTKDPAVPDAPVAATQKQTGPAGSTGATAAAPADTAANAGDGSGGAAAPNAPATLTVQLYWVEAGENALGVQRTIPYTKAVATAAVNALLAGPTAQEKSTWPAISTAIPAGTKLLGLTVANGVAKVDFSREFESGGGTFSVTARLAQVVYTLEQFPTIDSVEFYLEGVKVTVFSSEGIELDGPQNLDDYDGLLPIDA